MLDEVDETVDGLDVRRNSPNEDLVEAVIELDELRLLASDSDDRWPRKVGRRCCCGDKSDDVDEPARSMYDGNGGGIAEECVCMSSRSSHLSRTLVDPICCCSKAETQISSSSLVSVWRNISDRSFLSLESNKNVYCREGCFLSIDGKAIGITSVTIWY